jgi:predicted amidohydrolase YtcJ
MTAELILYGENIFDSISEAPFPGYVAIKRNRIIDVGHGSDYSAAASPETKILNCGSQLVMAGFHDSHTHLLMAGMFRKYVNLMDARSEEEAVEMVKAAEAQNSGSKEAPWVIGFSWYHVFWENRREPTKFSLDKAFPDKPVCLLNAEAHGAWVNSKALEIAGVTAATPNPFGGQIIHDENGEPTGVLLDAAVGLVTKYAFAFDKETEKEIIRTFMNGAREYGITSINDVQPYFHGDMGSLETYREMDRAGELTGRIHAAPDLLGDLDHAEEMRETCRSDKLRVELLKQFLDGVPTTHTGLLLEEYTDAPGEYGTVLNDLQAIEKAVPEGHRRGFSIKLHSCGDKSARLALDFYEKAQKMYGKNNCRHAIEHIEVLSPEDLPRFRTLGIVPSVQPEHLALTQAYRDNPYPEVLGKERAYHCWPNKSLYDTAGLLAIGSDCPVVDNNPFLEIFRGVTRVHNDGEPEGGWNPAEKLSMYEVLRSYTYGSAYGVSREQELGSLQPGHFADVIVIDTDLFHAAPKEIFNAKVNLTIMDGKIIYQRPGTTF